MTHHPPLTSSSPTTRTPQATCGILLFLVTSLGHNGLVVYEANERPDYWKLQVCVCVCVRSLRVRVRVFAHVLSCTEPNIPPSQSCVLMPVHVSYPLLSCQCPVRTQVTTTRNISGNWFVHWLCGGLEYQVDHHLYPTETNQ